MDNPQSSKAGAPARSLMPPHLVLRNFLDDETVADLLDYALSHQADFTPTELGSNAVDPTIRVSLGLRALGQYRDIIRTRIFDLLPKLTAELDVPPLEAPMLETELVAHGNGAFYKRHIDTQTARCDDVKQLRVLNGVYYFHAEPKAFGGGALRIHAIGGNGERHVDIEPLRNSLLVFPSWAPHEVLPVSCPANRFADARFAINCWVLHKRAITPA